MTPPPSSSGAGSMNSTASSPSATSVFTTPVIILMAVLGTVAGLGTVAFFYARSVLKKAKAQALKDATAKDTDPLLGKNSAKYKVDDKNGGKVKKPHRTPEEKKKHKEEKRRKQEEKEKRKKETEAKKSTKPGTTDDVKISIKDGPTAKPQVTVNDIIDKAKAKAPPPPNGPNYNGVNRLKDLLNRKGK
jgi:hypothetical protein